LKTTDSTLARIYSPISSELQRVVEVMTEECRALDPQIASLLNDAVRIGGKLLRPALLLFSGQACGSLDERHVRAAAAIELIHTATLVHDDAIDAAERRRRGATVNSRWGIEVSIMVGDLLFARALEVFAQVATPREQRLLSAALREVCEGELLQLLARRQRRLDEQTYYRIISRKSGALCSVTCAIGAALCGEADGRLSALADFGRCFGIALQITDDCLDIRGDEAVVGKTLGLDVLDGKLTLPLIYATRSPDPTLQAQLDELVANPTDGWRRRLADLLARCGAFEYCEQAARRYVRRGAARLDFLGKSPERASLLALADFVVERDS